MTVNQIREFDLDPEGQSSKQEEMAKLQKDQDELRQSLQQWCYAVYGEVNLPKYSYNFCIRWSIRDFIFLGIKLHANMCCCVPVNRFLVLGCTYVLFDSSPRVS